MAETGTESSLQDILMSQRPEGLIPADQERKALEKQWLAVDNRPAQPSRPEFRHTLLNTLRSIIGKNTPT